MKCEFGKYWHCDCGSDTMTVGCQRYDGKNWVTLREIENDPVLKNKVESVHGRPCMWVSDFTNITCSLCGRRSR